MKITQKLYDDTDERLTSENDDFKFKSTQFKSPSYPVNNIEKSVMSIRQQQKPLTYRQPRNHSKELSEASGEGISRLTSRVYSHRGSEAQRRP